MIWLILGIIGTVVLLVGLVLVPAWIGGASWIDVLIIFLSIIAILGFIGMIVFALTTGIDQVFG